MGRLITVSLILILGAWGGAGYGAIPDDAAAAPSSATRQPPPAPPIKYLEAGARLFNSAADATQLELASKYLQAADTYRDQLQPDEQATLDAYLKELNKAKAVVARGAAAPVATPTPPAVGQPQPAAPAVSAPPGVTASAPAGATQVPATADLKQRGRWLLHEAREQLHIGNYDMAQHKVDEAEALDIRWGLFDDTPAKVTEEIKKLRPRVATAPSPAAARQPHDRQTARNKLREARNALTNRQFEQAESIALDVKTWGLSYGFFEDNPDKVAAAARTLRRRDKIRNTPPRDQSSQGVYDVLVQESRQLISVGKLDEAEAKARMAQRMNVVPPLTAERAESVLHEIAMARAQRVPAAAGLAPTAVASAAPAAVRALAAEPASVTMEREANALLAKGDQEAAAAKFTEADRLGTGEALAVNVKGAVTTNRAADPAVQQIAANDPAGAPDLAAPTDPGAAQPVSAPAPQPAANRGDVLLGEAKDLYKSGNYQAARQLATQARTGKFGVEAQADEMLAQIGLAEQGGALALYEGALSALRTGDNARARTLLTEVAAAGESLDASMRAKVETLLEKLTADKGKTDGRSGTNTAQDAEALAAQKLNAEVGTKIAEGRRLHETDPDKAIAIYEKTVQAVHASGLSPDLTRPMVRRLEVAIELAKKDKVAFEVKMLDKQQRAEIEMKRLRILEADKAKKVRLKDLMDKAMTAYAEGNYIEAEAFAKRAMEIDPNELAASMLVFKAKTERHFKQDQKNKSDKEEGALTAFQEVDMASIADPEVQLRDIKYAKNFKDLTQARLKMNAKLEPRKDPKVMAIEAKLKDRISINMDKQPLSEAVTFLMNYTGLNVVLDPKALADEGLSQSSPVSLVTNDTQLKTVLKLMLRPLGLTYKLEDDVILITSPQATQASTITQTYYVGDLVMPPDHGPQNLMPDKLYNKEQNPTNDPNAGFGPNPGAFGPTDPRLPQGFNSLGAATGERPKVDMTPIIQLITTSIAPGTWRVQDGYGQDATSAYGLGGGFGGDAGGIDQQRQPGAIVPFFLSISLIIKHTAEVHEQVADLLRQLRRLQDLQVSVEVRFITVNDTFFEYIGVDFDFQIQSDTVGKHTTFAIPNPANALLTLASGTSTTSSTSSSTSSSSSSSTSGSSSSGGTSSTSGSSSSGGSSAGSSSSGGTTSGSSSSGGTTSGSSSSSGGGGGATQTPPYLVNPLRDHALGNNTPIIVGTQGGGLANFSPNLDIPYTGPTQTLVAPTQYQTGTGATFGIAFLSDLEVYLFMTAAQGDTRSNVLQAPKVTTFNGAPATIFSNQVQYYVAGLIPIVGPGAVAYTPQIGSVPNGVTMTVTPVVSADRRYVRLTLSPFFNANNGFTTFTSQSGAVGGSGLGGGSAVITTTIQLPNTTTNTVTTTVTVPDGGTVLLGGVKTLNETRTEYGVPVLSKIPMIDRLFRNIGIGRTTNSLMLMVTPRIIILEEEEEALGIPSVAF